MKNSFKYLHIIFCLPLLLLACDSKNDEITNPDNATVEMYFPPVGSDVWETVTPQSLNWNTTKINPLLSYLAEKKTKSFIILVNGKIVVENYFNGHSRDLSHYWASAGKTLTATTFGIAEQEKLVNRNDRVSASIGTGWTGAGILKENLITNYHLLTMTSGLSDTNADCLSPSCLTYLADAGNRWAYHNVYVKLQDVIAASTGQSFTNYFNTKLRNPIGMNGFWFKSDSSNVFTSNARSAARFGLLILNKGTWQNTQIINEDFCKAATSTTQNLNRSYGYLWWLNGQSSYLLPGVSFQFQGSIVKSAPADMYMALGKNDQKVYVIPSKKMVVIRIGDEADASNLALSGFDTELWTKISEIIN